MQVWILTRTRWEQGSCSHNEYQVTEIEGVYSTEVEANLAMRARMKKYKERAKHENYSIEEWGVD